MKLLCSYYLIGSETCILFNFRTNIEIDNAFALCGTQRPLETKTTSGKLWTIA